MLKEPDKEIGIYVYKPNFERLIELGYDYPYKSFGMVKIKHLNIHSKMKVDVICDACGSEHNITYQKYNVNLKRNHGEYHCKQCSNIKRKETNIELYGEEYTKIFIKRAQKTNLERYGAENTLSAESSIRPKIYENNIVNYGTKFPISKKEVRDRGKAKLMEKYGVDHYSKSEEFSNTMNKVNSEIRLEKVKKYTTNDFYLEGKDVFVWCDRCNKYYKTNIQLLYQRKITYNVEQCTLCNPLQKSYSNGEKEVVKFIRTIYSGEIIENTTFKKLNIEFSNKEIDIYLPDKKIGFEYCGTFWHSDKKKSVKYHFDKREKCLSANIKLIHIFEDDWIYQTEKIKDLIKRNLGVVDILAGNNYQINNIDPIIAKEFIEENSMMSYSKSNVFLGLIYGNQIHAVMSFNHKKKTLITSYCYKLGIVIDNAFTNILNYFIDNYEFESIQITYDYNSNDLEFIKNHFSHKKDYIDKYYVKDKKKIVYTTLSKSIEESAKYYISGSGQSIWKYMHQF